MNTDPILVGGLTRRDRRQLGITIRGIRLAAKELREDGREITSQAVLETIIDQNPTAWANKPGIDWDAIIAFIEKLLPLILKFIEIFSMI